MRLINCCDHEKHFLGGLPLVEQAKRFHTVGDAGVKGTEAGPRLLPATHCLGSTEDAWCDYRVTGPGWAFLLGSVPGTPSPLGPRCYCLSSELQSLFLPLQGPSAYFSEKWGADGFRRESGLPCRRGEWVPPMLPRNASWMPESYRNFTPNKDFAGSKLTSQSVLQCKVCTVVKLRST